MVLNIKGVQKITLIDYPDKIASTIFFGGCNFRCPSCHNPGLVFNKGKVLDKNEILDDLEKRKEFIGGVCLTGGEPLFSDLNELKNFIKEIKKKDLKVKVDTNGGFPEKLKELIDEKLVNYIAMDAKAPPELYSQIAGVKVSIDDIEKSIKIISESGVEHEFRTTVSPIIEKPEKLRWLTSNEIENIIKWIIKITKKTNFKYFLQKFVPRISGLVNHELEKFPETPEQLIKDTCEKIRKLIRDCCVRE